MRVMSRRLVLAALILMSANVTRAQTADDVINKSLAAIGGRTALGKLKFKACREQSTGHYAAALQHQFRLGTQQEGARFDHPTSGYQPEAASPGIAQHAHELVVGQRVGRRQIHRPNPLLTGNQ